jgi:hypothetical protein
MLDRVAVADAQRIAQPPVERAKKPSPAVSCSTPRKRVS